MKFVKEAHWRDPWIMLWSIMETNGYCPVWKPAMDPGRKAGGISELEEQNASEDSVVGFWDIEEYILRCCLDWILSLSRIQLKGNEKDEAVRVNLDGRFLSD